MADHLAERGTMRIRIKCDRRARNERMIMACSPISQLRAGMRVSVARAIHGIGGNHD